MNYVELWGNKIRAKDVVNANGKSIELKSIQISGNSGSGATLKTGLKSTSSKIISIDCSYPTIPWIIDGEYYVVFLQYMHLGSNIYGFGGINNASVSATVYYVDV